MSSFTLTVRLPHDVRQMEIPAQRRHRRLTDVLRSQDVPLNTRCGQRGLCEGCLVELLSGRLQQVTTGASLEGTGTPLSLRACEFIVPTTGRAEIHVPARSLLAHQPQVVTSFRLNVPRAHDPLWQSIRIPRADLPGDRSLEEAVRDVVSRRLECRLPLEMGPDFGHLQPSENGDYHLALKHLGDHRTLGVVDVVEPAFGVAVDVGTTTVVVLVVELSTGQIVGSASALNAQTRLGDNVLTRINLCMNAPTITRRMQQAVIRRTLSPLLTEALQEAGIQPGQLACMVIAGNTTMLHLLHGVDPSSMGVAPFTPAFLEHRVVDARELGLELKGPHGEKAGGESTVETVVGKAKGVGQMAVHSLPGAAAYVGADITAGVLASGMAYRDDTCLLVDLGTNGEIVLKTRNSLTGCATAAGPAFEGAGLTYGVRAGDGAIGHVWLEKDSPDLRVEVIGDGEPVGICGTAYIDFVGALRQIGMISTTARFMSDQTAGLMKHETHGLSFVVSHDQRREPLLITEADMASLLQAKAAVAAGVTCLLKRAQLTAGNVDTVYLAGGFGFHMHIDSLLGCGMLPGFRPEQIEMVGNTALAGAYLTLLDSGALREIRQLSERMEIIELNLDPEFESVYIDQLSLPA